MYVDKMAQESSKMDMKISEEKTAVQVVAKNRKGVNITLRGWRRRKLNQVEEFVCLGGQINSNGSTGCDTRRRIGLAVDAMRRLQTIYAATDVTTTTKSKCI